MSKPVPAVVADTVSALLRQSKIGEEFRADYTREISKVYEDAAAVQTVVTKSVPLTDAEIALIRESLKASV